MFFLGLKVLEERLPLQSDFAIYGIGTVRYLQKETHL
jgi:hypothetical protein